MPERLHHAATTPDRRRTSVEIETESKVVEREDYGSGAGLLGNARPQEPAACVGMSINSPADERDSETGGMSMEEIRLWRPSRLKGTHDDHAEVSRCAMDLR